MVDVDQLVALATNPPKGVCWFTTQEGDTASYISMLNEVEARSPGTVNRQQVVRTLNGELGHDVARYTVQRHFKGECECE